MCDCVYDEVQASELSIAPRVDFASLHARDALSTAAECTELTDQLPSAKPDYTAYSTIAQLSLAYVSLTYTPAFWSVSVYRPPRQR